MGEYDCMASIQERVRTAKLQAHHKAAAHLVDARLQEWWSSRDRAVHRRLFQELRRLCAEPRDDLIARKRRRGWSRRRIGRRTLVAVALTTRVDAARRHVVHRNGVAVCRHGAVLGNVHPDGKWEVERQNNHAIAADGACCVFPWVTRISSDFGHCKTFHNVATCAHMRWPIERAPSKGNVRKVAIAVQHRAFARARRAKWATVWAG
jgi:hypothetical protein